MRTIRASEIGSFLYCQRAWWYRRQDIESENAAEMLAGTELHHQHGQAVAAAGCLRSVAVALLLATVVLVVLHFSMQLL